MASPEAFLEMKKFFVSVTVTNDSLLVVQPHSDLYIHNAFKPDVLLGRVSKCLKVPTFLSIQSEAGQQAASQNLIVILKELGMGPHQAVFNLHKKPYTHCRLQPQLLYSAIFMSFCVL